MNKLTYGKPCIGVSNSRMLCAPLRLHVGYLYRHSEVKEHIESVCHECSIASLMYFHFAAISHCCKLFPLSISTWSILLSCVGVLLPCVGVFLLLSTATERRSLHSE